MPAALLAFAVSAAVGWVVVRSPRLKGILTRSAGGARWRADPVPLAGGLAMAAGFGVAVGVFGRGADGAGAVATAAGIGLAVGLLDDFVPQRPLAKLAGQAAAGLALAAMGVRLVLPGPAVVAWTATVLWVVVAANAFNLFDNVDAAAGGAGLVAAGAVWLWWAVGSGPSALAAALAGAMGGFLVFNLPPARVFMGDGGSHLVGVALAGLTILDAGRAGGEGPAGVAPVVLVPLVLLAVPLFDTTLVALERRRHRRPMMTGGRDHTSHRLLALGLGPGRVVALLWVLCALSAAVATLTLAGGWALGAGAALLAAGLSALGARLARVPVYG